MAAAEKPDQKDAQAGTKRLHGFARVISSQMSVLNSVEVFKVKFAKANVTYLLEATDLYPAALLRLINGHVQVTAATKEECSNWQGTGAQALLRCNSRQFLDIAAGKLNPAMAWVKRELTIRGPRKMLELNGLFKLIAQENQKKRQATNPGPSVEKP
jgi:hypothetical protein